MTIPVLGDSCLELPLLTTIGSRWGISGSDFRTFLGERLPCLLVLVLGFESEQLSLLDLFLDGVRASFCLLLLLRRPLRELDSLDLELLLLLRLLAEDSNLLSDDCLGVWLPSSRSALWTA